MLDIKELFEKILSEGNKDSFLWGIWVTITVLLILQSVTVQKEEFWACPVTKSGCEVSGLGYPSWQAWQYRATVKDITEKGDCINMDIERVNGQKFSGFYCVGDEVTVGNFLVKLSEIKPSLPRPVHLQYYQTVSVSGLFSVLAIGIPLFIVLKRYSSKKAEAESLDRKKREQLLNKKLKKIGLTVDELRNFFNDFEY